MRSFPKTVALFATIVFFLLPASPARAETNMCTPITAVPISIGTSGTYCLEQDLSFTYDDAIAAGSGYAVRVQFADDVVIDCNGHAIVGTVLADDDIPAQITSHFYYEAVLVASSNRVTVRNCRIQGFFKGISVGRASGTGNPRSYDLRIEDNAIVDSQIGIYFTAEGNSTIRRNRVSDVGQTALFAFTPPAGRTRIEDNRFSRIGNRLHTYDEEYGAFGPPVVLQAGGGDARMLFDGNVIAEAIAADGGTTTVIDVDDVANSAIGLEVTNNVLLAPAVAADKGSATLPIRDYTGPNCRSNVFVGYGASLPAGCTDPSNAAH